MTTSPSGANTFLVRGSNENLLPCPCCGAGLVEANHEFDICDVCGWAN